MKNLVLFSWVLLLTACETGTRYDTNSSTTEDKESAIIDMIHEDVEADDPTNSKSYYIDQGEDNYAEEISLVNSQPQEVEKSDILEESIEKSSQHFTGGTISDGLDIKSIRVGRHDGYVRLVLDSAKVASSHASSDKVGNYEVDYDPNGEVITVVLNGYRKFSAKFPTFPKSSIIEKMYFAKYLDDSGFKFYIKLRESTKIKVFDYESPARLIIDVQNP